MSVAYEAFVAAKRRALPAVAWQTLGVFPLLSHGGYGEAEEVSTRRCGCGSRFASRASVNPRTVTP